MSEPRPGYLLSHRATIAAFAGVLLGMLLAVLNQTIVATALPRIVADLGGLQHYSWVFSAYMLAATVTVPIYGRLSDIHGRRPFFVAGILIFMTGAVIGGTANSMTQLILARAVQGLGAGALIPLAMAVIGDLVPPSDRGRWQGLTGAVFGVGSVLGPLTGGWIADHTDWRWVFFVSLPVGLIALVVVLATLKIPPHPERATRIDYTGAALLAAAVSCILLGTVRAGEDATIGSSDVARAARGGHRPARRARLARAPQRSPDRPARAAPPARRRRGKRRPRSRSGSRCSARSCSSRCSCRACSASPPRTPASC